MYSSYRRKNSLRLRGYDYSRIGAYFVTMCTKDREPLFGTIKSGMMLLAKPGEIARDCWRQIPECFQNIMLDVFIVMPDHFHGIIVVANQSRLPEAFVPGGAISESPRTDLDDPLWRRRMLLPKIVGRFKQNSAKQINILRGTPGVPVWQRGYHDHIIRDAEALSRIRQYIAGNPQHRNSEQIFVAHQ